ncbi:hypothetical protein KY308_01135 [Candidatus Woesearchaeota archaeon]|nr:hypothetical protein [Candidatus Woesearchaeota archaeon]
MQKLKFLNTKEAKHIKKMISEQWDCDFKTDFAFLLSSKNKIYLVSKDIVKVDFEKLPISTLGVYFGELMNNELRLSIEGSQMIGSCAKKNVINLDKNQMRLWLKGKDLEIETKAEGFAILKYENDFMGTGKVKENKILNYVPKTRRILAED